MKDTKDNGSSAYPVATFDGYVHDGMSLRDRFAIAALQGMLSYNSMRGTKEDFSKSAYELADAMLRARAE